MMQNPQAVTVGARLARRLVMAVVLPAAARSPDAVAFCGGLLAGIAGGIAGAIGPTPCAELLRIALARIEGTPQLELPPGVRLQLAQAEASADAANDEAPEILAALAAGTSEQLETMRRVLAAVSAKAGIESDELVELLNIALEDVRAGRPPAPPEPCAAP